MAEEIAQETFAIHNEDGSVSLDPYAGKTREELKRRCGELCMALNDWQMIAMDFISVAPEAIAKISPEHRAEIERLIEAYKD